MMLVKVGMTGTGVNDYLLRLVGRFEQRLGAGGRNNSVLRGGHNQHRNFYPCEFGGVFILVFDQKIKRKYRPKTLFDNIENTVKRDFQNQRGKSIVLPAAKDRIYRHMAAERHAVNNHIRIPVSLRVQIINRR